jgi:hypothetical protein
VGNRQFHKGWEINVLFEEVTDTKAQMPGGHNKKVSTIMLQHLFRHYLF